MPRLGEKFTFELTWEEQIGLASVCDPNRDDLADRRPETRGDRRLQRRTDEGSGASVAKQTPNVVRPPTT